MFKLPIKQVVINDDALVTEIIVPDDGFTAPIAGDAGNLISIEGYGSFLVPTGTGDGFTTASTAAVAGIFTITAPVTTLAVGDIWDLKIFFKQGPRVLADVGPHGDSRLYQSRPLPTADAAGWVDAFIDAIDNINPEYSGEERVLEFTDGGDFLIVTFKEGYEGCDIEVARSAETLDIESQWITCALATTTPPEIGINTGKQIEAEVRLATHDTLNPYGIYVGGNEPSVDIEGAYTEQHWKGAIGTVNPTFAPHDMVGYGDANTETIHGPSEYSVFTHETTATGALALIDLLLTGGTTPSASTPVVTGVTDGTPIAVVAGGPTTGTVDSVVTYAAVAGTGALSHISDNVGVATVNVSSGLVTYVADGTCTITSTSVENGAFAGTTAVTATT